MKVIYTEKSQLLAARTAQKLGCKLSNVKYTTFPDGELYVRVEELDDEMVVVASTVDTTTALQVMLLMDACEGKDVTLVLPYMGYARQDKRRRTDLCTRTCTRIIRGCIPRLYCKHPRSVCLKPLPLSGSKLKRCTGNWSIHPDSAGRKPAHLIPGYWSMGVRKERCSTIRMGL